MEVLEVYSEALAEYKAKNYERALQLVEELKSAAPNFERAFLLEAYIRRAQGLYVAEIWALQGMLERFQEDKSLTAEVYSLLGSACHRIGLPADSIACFVNAALLETELKARCSEWSNAIFAANSAENFDAEDFANLYAEYRNCLAEIEPFPRKFYNHEKLRIGYISGDFHEHSVMYFAQALIKGANKNLFEIYCYYSNTIYDFVTAELVKNFVDMWRDTSSLSFLDTAKMILYDEIDILFDFSGHTRGNLLPVLAYRPAAVQISGIGYMNSTGLNCVDYFLSDKICAGNAAAMEKYFTEKIIRLSHSHFCYTPIKPMPAPTEAPCLSKGCVTFGCFNNFSKVTDSILAAWREILSAVPKSRLILKHQIFDNEEGKAFVKERLANLGLDTARIEFRGFTKEYLREYGEIDIALDTFPYAGGLTTCEALYMGVPVISLYGDRHGTRFGLSILKNIGVEELATATLQEYVERAVALAFDKDLLGVLHKNLRRMMQKSHLMNAKEYVSEIEENYLRIWQEAKADSARR